MLRDFYRSADRAAAETALADWHRCAGDYDIAETNRLARTLRAWDPELLAYFDTRLTNGPTEGVNRIIKAVKRQGFGYTNADNYRLRVLYRCARHTEPARQPNPRCPTKRGEPTNQRQLLRRLEKASRLCQNRHAGDH